MQVAQIAQLHSTENVNDGLHNAITTYLNVKWPVAQRVNNGTYLDAKSCLRKFAAVISDRACATMLIDEAIDCVQKFCDYRRVLGVGATRIDNDRRCLSAFFTYLIKTRAVRFHGNPTQRKFLELPAKTSVVKPPLNEDETQKLLTLARELDWYPVVVLCLACGLRPRGACRMQWADIDFMGKTIVVTEKRRTRVVPMGEWAIRELVAWRVLHVWTPMHHRNPMKKLQKLREKHGLSKRVTLQGLRRTFLFKLFRSGEQPQMVAAIAGNSIGVIQRHYVNFSSLVSHDVVNKLNFDS